MIRKLLRAIVAAAAIAVVAGVGWLAYAETGTSEAAHFEESINMVHYQTDRMSATLGDAGTFVSTTFPHGVTPGTTDKQVAAITNISELIGEWAQLQSCAIWVCQVPLRYYCGRTTG
jgi:hypothetical protein